ncbi:hypothetical protein B0J12DRAFT_6953 [Macrophomina phaseolina]|uniref:Secreted protein n=1 Tax=Macrophomina phaseolina TaxID=35725 RepID=A0ABQ8GTT9_9PEZI|nr:hypothetical protein B0J12DRAFT_6953 [Macrophomina phaseolina]
MFVPRPRVGARVPFFFFFFLVIPMSVQQFHVATKSSIFAGEFVGPQSCCLLHQPLSPSLILRNSHLENRQRDLTQSAYQPPSNPHHPLRLLRRHPRSDELHDLCHRLRH